MSGVNHLKNAGFFVGLILLFYSSIMLWQSVSLVYYTETGPGPGFFPLWISIILLVLSIVYLFESLKKEIFLFSRIIPKGVSLVNIITVLFSIIIFMLLVNYTGFVLASVTLLFLVLIRNYKWYQSMGTALVVSVLLFYFFKTLLNVPLPVNVFGW
jgi:putative tricarboxylic transport membrane protein